MTTTPGAVAFVDTNVLVRHLTGDPPDMAQRATACLRESGPLLLVDLVVAELVYVLASVYERPRDAIAATLRALLALPSVQALDTDLLLRTVELYEHERLGFADAYLVAAAERSGVGVIVSFDRSIDRVATVTRVEPA